MKWFRKILANLSEQSSAQMRADLKAAEIWLQREMEQNLRDTLR